MANNLSRCFLLRDVVSKVARLHGRAVFPKNVMPYVVLTLVSLVCLRSSLAIAQDSDRPLLIDDVLSLLQVRDEAIQSIDATFKVVDGASAEIESFYRARHQSGVKLAAISGDVVPPYEEPIHLKKEKSVGFRRFARNKHGHQRYEYSSPNSGAGQGNSVVTVFDGVEWRTLANGKGLIHDSTGTEVLSRFLGLGFRWTEVESNLPFRKLYEVLNEEHRQGRLFVGQTPELDADESSPIMLVTRHPVTNLKLREAGTFVQHEFWFAPDYGMAPVRMEIKNVYRDSSGAFVDTVPSDRKVSEWSDYQKIEGVWLPQVYKYRTVNSLMFPSQGDNYPPGFDLTKSVASDFRTESYNHYEMDVEIVKLAVNETAPDEIFALTFPEGTFVYNRLTDKSYHVGDGGRLVEQSIRIAANSASPRSSSRSRSWILGVNVIAVALFLLFFIIRHYRSRPSRGS